MSHKYMPPTPYWVRNRSRDAVVMELTAIAHELAQADDGRLPLTPDMRTDLEARREALKEELARLDAKAQEEDATVGNVAELLPALRRMTAQVEEHGRKLATLRQEAEQAGLRVPKASRLEFVNPDGSLMAVHGSAHRQFALPLRPEP